MKTQGNFIVISPNEVAELDKLVFSKIKEEDCKEYLEKVQPLFYEYKKSQSIHELQYDDFEGLNQYVKNVDGKYEITENGQHRMYVAKKYGLSMLLCA